MDSAAGAIRLGAVDLCIAAGLVLVAGGVSFALRLDLERRLLWASVRTVAQLLLIGFILEWVFRLERMPVILALIGVMILVASRSAVERASRTHRGATLDAFVTLVFSGLITATLVTAVIIRVQPWYRPQYLIPLLGMILGNGLTGVSLCLDQLLEAFAERRAEVETELAHGATRWEAARAPLSGAVRRGMIPIVNSMMVVGIVSLPGMMTGQILAGEKPIEAVKYQIVVMFMIAAATALGCMGVALLTYRRLFNARHQLMSERIHRRKN